MFLRPSRNPNHTLQSRLVPVHLPYLPGHSCSMLTELYVEALLVDEDLADQVWELWDDDVIDDELAAIAWLLLDAPAFGAVLG